MLHGRKILPYAVFADQCIQKTQTCSVGGRTTARLASRREFVFVRYPAHRRSTGMLEILWLFERDDIFARHTQRLIPRLRLNSP
jgi:hypothetical protein